MFVNKLREFRRFLSARVKFHEHRKGLRTGSRRTCWPTLAKPTVERDSISGEMKSSNFLNGLLVDSIDD